MGPAVRGWVCGPLPRTGAEGLRFLQPVWSALLSHDGSGLTGASVLVRG